LASQVEARPLHGLARLPVDRVFTMKGHGAVVTGTLISGTFQAGDEVEILPEGLRSSIRSLQSHNQSQEEVFPGERAAVNLRGADQSEIHRGDILTHPGDFVPSYIIDVDFQSLKRSDINIGHGQRIRLHHYTNDVEARIFFPGKQTIAPGERLLVQFRASSPLVPSVGDKIIVRGLSPVITLGGGVIMNPRGEKLKGRNLEAFSSLEGQDEVGVLSALIRSSGLKGIGKNDLLGLSGLSSTRLEKALKSLLNSQDIVLFDSTESRFIHSSRFEMVLNKAVELLSQFHERRPLEEGMPKQELRSNLPGDDKLFRKVMEKLQANKKAVQRGDIIRSFSHKVTLDENEETLKKDLSGAIAKGLNAPPLVKELVKDLAADPKQVRNMLKLLEKEGRIVRIKEDLYFDSDTLKKIRERLLEYLQENQGITPSQFSGVTGASRKYNIPLLEFFDRERFTMRVGDQRVLRGSGNSGAGGRVE
jgi:selenocysteine-specific elongation factor